MGYFPDHPSITRHAPNHREQPDYGKYEDCVDGLMGNVNTAEAAVQRVGEDDDEVWLELHEPPV